jgi:ribosomal protein L24E
LEQNPNKIDWSYLCNNVNPNAIHLLERNLEKIDWYKLSENPNAIHLLEQNLDKVHWDILSMNPNAIHLLEQNPDKIAWYFLSHNTNAIHLLKENPDEINWTHLSCRPSIFEYDYEAMRLRMKIIAEDLMADRFHPRNFEKWIGWGFEEFKECEF